MKRALVSLAAGLALAFAALPALAGPLADRGPPTGTPGNDPCATGQAVGNPCNGNPGNGKGVGAAGNGGQAGPDPVWCREFGDCTEAPGVGGGAPVLSGEGGVFITQIGEGNSALVDQSGADHKARAVLRQEGEANQAELHQSGLGGSAAELSQEGELNLLLAVQAGDGRNSLLAAQAGLGNRAEVAQNAAVGVNAAAIVQFGTDNVLSLTQSGPDNDAVLTQNGVGNAMTATQTGGGNRLTWTQDGNHLPDLGVHQTGAMAISIHQSNGS
jgi:minor curlin subunit